jgi:hypothetical protein
MLATAQKDRTSARPCPAEFSFMAADHQSDLEDFAVRVSQVRLNAVAEPLGAR